MPRTAGVLLHLTSLPSRFGVGDLGPAASEFARWLSASGARLWQILPVTPTGPGLGNSPYSSFSAFAGHPLLISPEILVQDDLLTQADLDEEPAWTRGRVDYDAAWACKSRLLRTAFARVRGSLERDTEFSSFCWDNGTWLNDHALFAALKDVFGGRPWTQWPEELKDREEAALTRWGEDLASEVLFEKFLQYHFYQQWGRLRETLAGLGLEIMGDLPIYVNHDSADVWANRDLFKLDGAGEPQCVAGVPPDYFSETGQRWGNPVYDWEACKARGFDWWIARLWHHFGLFDRVRLDHFRGFSAYWEIPAAEETAVCGEWVPALGRELFDLALERIGRLPIVAEDLGVITPDVVELKEEFGFPGMHVLQFGWAGDPAVNTNAFHNHVPNSVAFTGTHDNATTRDWFANEAGTEGRKRLRAYLGRRVESSGAAWECVRLCLMSVAETAVVPAQDLLGLDGSSRMNTPGVSGGNWTWRLEPDQLDQGLADRFAELVGLFGRNRPLPETAAEPEEPVCPAAPTAREVPAAKAPARKGA